MGLEGRPESLDGIGIQADGAAELAVEEELVRPQHVAVLARTHRRAMGLSVEARAIADSKAALHADSALHEEALTLPQPRRRPVARGKPRGSARDRLRRKRTTGGRAAQAKSVRIEDDAQQIGTQLVAAIRGWLGNGNDESSA